MTLTIVPFTGEYEEGVRRFNGRLRAGNVRAQFPTAHVPDWLPRQNGRLPCQEYFLAVDGQSGVHGAYVLKHQDFLINGQVRTIADYRLPLSEGIVQRQYNFVGLQLLTSALGKQPLLFALGMGGHGQPLPKMLKAARWSIAPVPFFFRVVHPRAFFKNIVPLRRSKSGRIGCDLLAASGAGWVLVRSAAVVRPGRRVPRPVNCEEVAELADWTDDLWERCKDRHALIAVRDSRVLRALYPRRLQRFIRLKILREGRAIGWAVLLVSRMSGHKQFGNMKVGTLVDCLAEEADAVDVVACARDVMEARGADLLVSNQSHAAWTGALRRCGFFEGPTNFLFAASKKLAAHFQPFDKSIPTFHLNRGDGDGPIHL